MDIKEMTIDQIEERKNAIVGELDSEGADLDALEAEMRALNEELETRRRKTEIRNSIAAGKIGETVRKAPASVERPKKTNEEVRASKEYIEAFARYIKTEDASECRALLTEQVSGSVPVPVIVDDIIKTAWDSSDLLSRVNRTDIRGNVKVAFELSADEANVHIEGTTAPTEEALSLGIVELIPRTVKKWIRVSDEAIAMGGEALVSYIYRELTYRIIKKLEDLVVSDIKSAPTSATSSAASAEAITEAPSVTTVSNAADTLSDEARDLVVIMNRRTRSKFTQARAAANFAIDPFDGLTVIYNNSLPAYDSASANAVYAIVGDLNGEQVNYPEGDGVAIKYDDLSEAEDDLVKIVGRQYAGHAVTACGRFCNIKKPSGTT